ncbi:MAG: HPF/RaiA family ribosome-associated protein [Nitrospiraceae bacterium]|nr:HPF/RaiA family ribosome-associated protein [Nitrospiraceae bacterium]
MKINPQITLKNVPHSSAVEAKIREKIVKLDQFSSRLMGCRVTVEECQRKQHQGKIFSVHIDMTVPGKELVVNRVENEDLYVAVRDAFDAAKRQLEEHSRKRRGDVKSHTEAPLGKVAKIFPFDGYGFITTSDGREIYFHRNSVIDPSFDRLEEGAEVAFLEEQGKEGPQAVRVAAR